MSLEKKTKAQRKLDQYQIDKTIGEGTFGKVKLGIHIPTGEKVSIKILEKDKIQDKEDSKRISREIKILKLLNHPNIIKIYQIIEDSKNYYIIMEYAKGGELFDYIVKKKHLSEKESSIFFYQLINAIEFIHKKNISHRDIKPENLLLKSNLILTLIDFGLSIQYYDKELLNTPCGSPCYAAPEMIMGKKYNGLYSDLWSCGIVLYAMVCGYLPFEDKDNEKLYRKIINGKLDFPERISFKCKDLIKKILNVNAKKRLSINDIKNHPFLELGKSFYKKEFKNFLEFGDDIKKENINVDIVERIIQNYDVKKSKDEIIDMINRNKHNSITTTYFLMLKKYGFSGFGHEIILSFAKKKFLKLEKKEIVDEKLIEPESDNENDKNKHDKIYSDNIIKSNMNNLEKINKVDKKESEDCKSEKYEILSERHSVERSDISHNYIESIEINLSNNMIEKSDNLSHNNIEKNQNLSHNIEKSDNSLSHNFERSDNLSHNFERSDNLSHNFIENNRQNFSHNLNEKNDNNLSHNDERSDNNLSQESIEINDKDEILSDNNNNEEFLSNNIDKEEIINNNNLNNEEFLINNIDKELNLSNNNNFDKEINISNNNIEKDDIQNNNIENKDNEKKIIENDNKDLKKEEDEQKNNKENKIENNENYNIINDKKNIKLNKNQNSKTPNSESESISRNPINNIVKTKTENKISKKIKEKLQKIKIKKEKDKDKDNNIHIEKRVQTPLIKINHTESNKPLSKLEKNFISTLPTLEIDKIIKANGGFEKDINIKYGFIDNNQRLSKALNYKKIKKPLIKNKRIKSVSYEEKDKINKIGNNNNINKGEIIDTSITFDNSNDFFHYIKKTKNNKKVYINNYNIHNINIINKQVFIPQNTINLEPETKLKFKRKISQNSSFSNNKSKEVSKSRISPFRHMTEGKYKRKGQILSYSHKKELDKRPSLLKNTYSDNNMLKTSFSKDSNINSSQRKTESSMSSKRDYPINSNSNRYSSTNITKRTKFSHLFQPKIVDIDISKKNYNKKANSNNFEKKNSKQKFHYSIKTVDISTSKIKSMNVPKSHVDLNSRNRNNRKKDSGILINKKLNLGFNKIKNSSKKNIMDKKKEKNHNNHNNQVIEKKIDIPLIGLTVQPNDSFAICTSNLNYDSIINNLTTLCKENQFILKKNGKLKFNCIKGNNEVFFEITNSGKNNMLKLYHMKGKKEITKDLIKKIIINIGF